MPFITTSDEPLRVRYYNIQSYVHDELLGLSEAQLRQLVSSQDKKLPTGNWFECICSLIALRWGREDAAAYWNVYETKRENPYAIHRDRP